MISSDLPFNDGILDESNSIRIDPNDIGAMTDAIIRLKDDFAFRNELSKGALRKANGFDISVRASRVLEFIASCDMNTV